MRGTYDVVPTADMEKHTFNASPINPTDAYGVLSDGVWRVVFVYEKALVIRTGQPAESGTDYLTLRDVEDGREFEVAVKDFNTDAEVALCA
jgi:hypothetical protein